ncbi:hypothetical protein AAJ76_6600020714 [Vairimorpha ceranae]|uniref:NUC153 domain-containing protein n=1 Tax=Vairimorpha ceranae TaxID=40302 RepID=A0A0F9YP97_9MICR|nr:hypothetical protein AAJ76_6600020714 [Vairimorpha ceranae]KAF5140285.1 hypothetical protein G9O61_00g015410 [Vairimorpha ceranae]KKO74492.1 hypothetical protein AAJ76_6600020714 [Vairimorpha ceranae]
MTEPTQRLAVLNCNNFNPLFDLLEEITTNYKVEKCTSKSGNKCFVVKAEIKDNIKIYEVLNNLEVEDSVLDCRFVGPELIFDQIEDVNREVCEDVVEQSDSNKVLKDDLKIDCNDDLDTDFVVNLYDSRFLEMYINDDFYIDTSHDEYKKCSFLKYFIEAKKKFKHK